MRMCSGGGGRGKKETERGRDRDTVLYRNNQTNKQTNNVTRD